MTDKRIKEDCPFCGHPADDIQIKTFKEGCTRIYCPSCWATFEGLESKAKIINRWNARYQQMPNLVPEERKNGFGRI